MREAALTDRVLEQAEAVTELGSLAPVSTGAEWQSVVGCGPGDQIGERAVYVVTGAVAVEDPFLHLPGIAAWRGSGSGSG